MRKLVIDTVIYYLRKLRSNDRDRFREISKPVKVTEKAFHVSAI